MTIRKTQLEDKGAVLNLLDEFQSDCIKQITLKPGESNTAKTIGSKIYESLLAREDYCIFLLVDQNSEIVGILTRYLCPLLRSGEMRAEVEKLFIKKATRESGNAHKLIDEFLTGAKTRMYKKLI